MMRTVKIHTMDSAELEWSYEWTAQRLLGAIQALPKKIQNPGTFLQVALERVALAVMLQRPETESWESLRDAMALGLALFRGGSAETGERVEVEYRGSTLEIQGGRHEYVDGQHWLWSWSVARLLRDRPAMAELCDFDAKKIDAGRSPAFFIPLIQALQARESGKPWETLHDRALADAQAFRPKARAKVPLSWLLLMDSLDTTGRPGPDVAAFNRGLEAALIAHREEYGRPELGHLTYSRLDWLCLGFCALAQDEGLPLQVTSDYIPVWLTKGPL